MAIALLLKANATAGQVPTASSVKQRELAINTADGLLYTQKKDGSIITINPPIEPTYNGTTLYQPAALTRFANTGTTDSNGRVTFNITKDGTATGAAIFSKVFSIEVTGVATSTSDVTKYPQAVIESVTAKVVTVRLLVPTFVLVGGTSMVAAGAGYSCYLHVLGAQ